MSATGFTYKGPGRVYGVPAHDITADEFERLDGKQRRVVLHSGWYEPAKAKSKAAPKDAPDATKEGGE